MRDSLERKLMGKMSHASIKHGLIEPDDRIMVGVSGGKDSWVMLHLLRKMQRRIPFDFSIVAVNLDQGHPGFPAHVLENHLKSEGYEYQMIKKDTYSIVLDKTPKGKTYCALCSRLRRGILYNVAEELGATKIALGHHLDDAIETLMLNLFFAGQIKSMPPRLTSDDGRNTIIRPLLYCSEDHIAAYCESQGFPVIPCTLCGTQPNLQRQKIKAMLKEWNEQNPKVKGNIFAALGNVRTSHLLDESLQALFQSSASPSGLSPLEGLGGCGLS